MERMLRLLLSLGAVKNYMLHGRTESRFPPIILVWYRQIRAGAVEELSRAFASYHGSLEWSLRAIPGGWAVMPKRILELAAERGLPGFRSGAEVLWEEEPTFAGLARRDLEALAEHVCGCLGRSSKTAE